MRKRWIAWILLISMMLAPAAQGTAMEVESEVLESIIAENDEETELMNTVETETESNAIIEYVEPETVVEEMTDTMDLEVDEKTIVGFELLNSDQSLEFPLYQKYYDELYIQQILNNLQFVVHYEDGTNDYFGMSGIEGVGKPEIDLSNVNWNQEGDYSVYINFAGYKILHKVRIVDYYVKMKTNSDITLRIPYDVVGNYNGLSLKVTPIEDENEKQFVRNCSQIINGNPNGKVFIYDFIFIDSVGNEIETPTPNYAPDLIVTMPIPDGVDYSNMELYTVEYEEELFGTMFQIIEINENEITFIITSMGHYAIGAEPDDAVTGVWGDNITWRYKNETLTISGKGDMLNTVPMEPSWNQSFIRNYVKKVVVEDGVTSVCNMAFWNYQKIEEVILADTIREIGYSAFGVCSNLKTMRLPRDLVSIGDGAFDYCVSLENLILPANFKDFGMNVFSLCHSLKNLYVDSDSKIYTSIDGVLYSYDKKKVVMYPYGRTDSRYVIPDGVTTIGEMAFANNDDLVEIVVPQTLRVVENGAFSACTKLEDFEFPDGFKEIGGGAFQQCSSLTHIYLPSTVEKIGENAFGKCTNLEIVTMPNTLQIMNESIFSSCIHLKKCDIPKNVTRIEGGLFAGCTSITEITVPAGVTYVGPWSFANCDSLETIYFEGPAPSLEPMDATGLSRDIMPNSGNLTAYVYADYWNSYASLRSEYNKVKWVKRGFKTITGFEIVREPYVKNYLVGTALDEIKFDGMEFEVRFADGSVEICEFGKSLEDGRNITWTFDVINYAGSSVFEAQINGFKDSFNIIFTEKPYVEEKVNDTTLIVETMTSSEEADYIRVETNNGNADVIVFDMHLEDSEGNVYELNDEKVKVIIPVPEGWDTSTLKVYYVNSEKNVMEELDVVLSSDGKTISFETTHFSYYAFVENKVVESYPVIYDCNGSASKIVSQEKIQGKAMKVTEDQPRKTLKLSLNANGGNVKTTSKNLRCMFDTWNTSLNGKGTNYDPGTYYKNDAAITLYAQWMNPKAGVLEVPTKEGYSFKGWYTKASGGTEVTKDTVVTKNMTLYAHWIKSESVYTGVEAFVEQLYKVCLGRKPDAVGLKDWANKLTSKQIDGVTAAYGFVFSQEFKNKNLCNEDYVKQLYSAFLGRTPDKPGLEDWVGQLEKGTTREAVFNGFALSQEFKGLCEKYGINQGAGIEVPEIGTMPNGSCSICGKEDGVTGFVKRLYQVCLNRTPDEAGLADWVGKLRNHTATGRSVAYGFIFSQEFMNKKYSNEDYVEYLYNAFMGRGSDPVGKADWLNRMSKRKWTRKQVFDGFVGSQEFTNICNSYGITRD